LKLTLPLRWQKRNTLKLKMTMPVAVLTAFLLIITTWMMFGFFRDALESTIAREQAALVRTLAGQIDDRIYSVEQHLLALAKHIDTPTLDSPSRAQVFLDKQWNSREQFSAGLAIFSADGSLRAGQIEHPFLLSATDTWKRQVQVTLRTRQPRVRPYIQKVSDPSSGNGSVLLVTVPIVDIRDNVIGVVGGAVDLLKRDMLGYLQNFGRGHGSYLTLCNAEYMLVIKNESHFTAEITEQGKRLRRRVVRGEEITTSITRPEGDDTLSSLRMLTRVDWVLGVHEPLERVYAPLASLKRELVLALSGKIALAALAVWLLMRQLLKPLKRLTRKVVQAEHSERTQGDTFHGQAASTLKGDEFEVLHECFDQMLGRVERQRRSLEKQLDQLQSLLDAIPNPIFYTDALGHYMGFNKAFVSRIGRPRHLMLGDGVGQALPEEVARIIKNCGTGYGMTHQSEQTLVFADGKEHPVIFSAASYRQVDNASPGVVGSIIDISARREIEDQLRKLSRAVEQSPNAIIVTDINGTIEYVNSTFTRHTGYAPQEVIGENPRILNAGSAPKEYFRTLWNTILNGHDWRGEFRNRKKNGELFWEYALISPLKDSRGLVTHFVAVKQDITERKLADRREELTAKVLTLLSISTGRDDKIQDILELIRDFTGCEYVGLRLKEHATYAQYRSMKLKPEAHIEGSAPAPEEADTSRTEKMVCADTLCVDILDGKVDVARPCFTPGGSFWSTPGRNCIEHMQVEGCSERFCTSMQARSVALIPLKLGEQNVGMLQVLAEKENMITRGTVEFLESIAGSIAVAFEHRQVTEQLHEKENKLDFLTQYDPLTELPNRTLLADKLEKALKGTRRSGSEGALLLFDIDRFKTINDSLGHTQGDRLLREVAQRLQKGLKPEDQLARIGGDEFVVVLTRIEDAQQVRQRVEELMQLLTPVVQLSGFELYVTANVGISMFPTDGSKLEDLLQAAEVAMYRAKQGGRNRHQFYRTDMNERNRELLHLESQLRLALERDQFEVYYQAKIDLHTGLVTGAEALLRWHHPEIGIVSPADFIPLAEDTGLIVPIGEWVLRTTCAQALAWNRKASAPLRVAVNLSARQFMEPDLLEQLDRALADTGVPSEYLELEITESVAMNSVEESIASMSAIRTRGVKLSIDDFGTGYSSLSYLKRFPIDCLKIDKSFVSNIETDPNDAAIASSVVALAKAMDLRVVAEGIEDRSQLKYLQHIGCDEAQGFLLARPMPAPEFEKFVSSWEGLPS
jgi:diguanylate cyclase (GGDEF)-like protein/PAS domain S-box-containing protein